MKRNAKNIVIGLIGAFTMLCGDALAAPVNSAFLFVDINGPRISDSQIGPTQTNAGWNGWSFVNPPGGNEWHTNFNSSHFVFNNGQTPTDLGVTLFATNYHQGGGVTVPGWYTPSDSPCTLDRDNMGGEAWAALYNDFLRIDHNTLVGFGWDYISIAFTNLIPGTNYEITVWNYDPNEGGTSFFQAWGTNNPSANANYGPASGGGGTTPKLARARKSGTWPSQAAPNNQQYAYSASFFVTADSTGSATVYGWEDDDSWGGMQDALLNGFAIGIATNLVNTPTNAITAAVNPVPASYGPPTVWPYTAGIKVPSDGTYTEQPFDTNTILGQTFLAARDFRLRNFYIACKGTNSGNYTLLLYDLGTSPPPSSFIPTNVNLLSHPELPNRSYWSFSPAGLTNGNIVKFKLLLSDQPILTNGHYYFLGFQFAGGAANDMIWQRTTSGSTYAGGSAYRGSATRMTNDVGGASDFIMAIDLLTPNLALSVTNSPLTGAWPGTPMIQYSNPPAAPDYTLPLHVLEGIQSGRALSMSFKATKDFNFGGVSMLSRGTGSSNVLFTLDVYDVTNTFFTVTNTIEKWPRNFQPDIDTAPLGVPIFGTNLNFYYTTNLADNGTNDHFLTLTVNNPAYQVQIKSNHSYVVEISADTLGENAAAGGLFQWVRDIGQGNFQIELFPEDGDLSAGFRTNMASGGTAVNVLPRGLSRNFTDPEQFAGAIAGNVRFLMMAVYGTPAAPQTITISSVTRSAGNTVITWNSQAGATYSILKTNQLWPGVWSSNWPPAVTGYPSGGASGGSLSYTDATPATINFYRIRSP